MKRVILYSTEPCGFCGQAKALLRSRGVEYDEVNLAKDPDGRGALSQKTGLMTFPQVVIDGESIGGLRELVAFDRAGGLAALSRAA